MAPQRVQEPSTRSPVADARPDAGWDMVRTVCGREFTVGELRLEHVGHPIVRVSFSTHPLPQDGETLWASLTPDEARRLAAYLLSHAAAADAAGMMRRRSRLNIEITVS
jgi:putative redox protein